MTTSLPSPAATADDHGPHYKWIALSNTTLGMLIATINSSIVLIALPDIFRGIHLNPLEPQNTSYLLWMMMGFLVVTAVLVVSFGRLGDMFGRARMYNLGFLIFTVSSIFLAVTWFDGSSAAIWLIFWRVIQGIGGAFLMANSSAILTDAFPTEQRGLALGINGVAAISGSFLGLLVGGVLAPINWHLIFLVSVPFGVLGTIWAYLKLEDTGVRKHAAMDWWGNVTFAVGLVAVLVGITYGIQPYGDSAMGWTSPMVLSCLIGGTLVLAAFVVIETRVAEPLFNLHLFANRSFTFGNIANLMASIGRGGLQFILIIWLQGIWLPQHGYTFEKTPLWAAIYMVPMTVGFLLIAPISGALSDRMGTKWFTTTGMVITAGTFAALVALPVDFSYPAFAIILLLNGIGMGLFSSPNRAEVMRVRVGHDDDLPERRHGAVDRPVLQPDDQRSGHPPARHDAVRPRRERGSGRRRRTDRAAACGRRAVRRVPGIQPDRDASRRPAERHPRRQSRDPHRPRLLPAPDQFAVRGRPVGGVHLRHRVLRDRRRRVAVHQPAKVRGAGACPFDDARRPRLRRTFAGPAGRTGRCRHPPRFVAPNRGERGVKPWIARTHARSTGIQISASACDSVSSR